MPKLEHYSYSGLTSWGQCPASAAWHYVEGHEAPTSPEAHRGTLVHEAAEKYALRCMRQGREMDRRYAADLADACPDPEAAKIIHSLPDFLAFDPALVIADERGIEREWQVRLASGDLVVGRYDRLEWNEADAELVVTDYKSGACWSFPDEPPQQLCLYGWAARREWPRAEIITLRLQYLGSRTQAEWSLGRDDDLLRDDWVQEWIDQVKALEAPYTEQPGSWCAYCGRLAECANGREALANGVIDSAEKAAEVAGHCIVLEEAAARLRKALDAWRRENGGEVRVGDMVRGDFWPEWALQGKPRMVPRATASAESVIDALAAAGGSLQKAIRWDSAYLGKLAAQQVDPEAPGAIFAGPEDLTDNPARKRLLALLEPEKATPRAGWRRASAEETIGMGDD